MRAIAPSPPQQGALWWPLTQSNSMPQFTVHQQVNPSKTHYDYEVNGSFFRKMTVVAKNQKDAWNKVSGIVCKVEKLSQRWPDKVKRLGNNFELMRDRNRFVCEYVALMTQKKNQRLRVNGYQLKKVGEKYQIFWDGKTCGYPPMGVSDAYGWVIRLPLIRLGREANDWRLSQCEKYRPGWMVNQP